MSRPSFVPHLPLPRRASASSARPAQASSPPSFALSAQRAGAPSLVPLTCASDLGLSPAPSAPACTPCLDRTPRQTDAQACPSGSFSLPHVLRALRRDADPATRDGRQLRSRSGAARRPGDCEGQASGDETAGSNGAALPAALEPRRLLLQLGARDLGGRAARRRRGEAACGGSDIPVTSDINRSFHWPALRDVRRPARRFHVIAEDLFFFFFQ